METVKQEVLKQGSDHRNIIIFNVTAPNSDYDMYSSKLVGKMNEEAKKQGINVTVRMESASKIDSKGKEADIILLSPPLFAMVDEVKGKYSDKVVKIIDEKDYGFLNAENILNIALS